MDSVLTPSHCLRPRCLATTCVALAVLCLISCRPTTIVRPEAPGPAPTTAAAAHGNSYRIDPAASEFHVLVYRAGALAGLGHNHIIAAPSLEGAIVLTADRAGSSFELLLAVDQLEVDSPSLRARYGDPFASLPTDADITSTRENMLGPALLNAAAYPYIRIAGRLQSGPNGDAVALEIALKETLLQRAVPISVQISADRIEAQGMLKIDHSELGLTPFSIMLGALRVAETIEIRFSLTARRTSTS